MEHTYVTIKELGVSYNIYRQKQERNIREEYDNEP